MRQIQKVIHFSGPVGVPIGSQKAIEFSAFSHLPTGYGFITAARAICVRIRNQSRPKDASYPGFANQI